MDIAGDIQITACQSNIWWYAHHLIYKPTHTRVLLTQLAYVQLFISHLGNFTFFSFKKIWDTIFHWWLDFTEALLATKSIIITIIIIIINDIISSDDLTHL